MRVSHIKQRVAGSALFRDSMWSLIGTVCGQGLSLIAGIVVARFLGRDIYGEYGMIKSTLVNVAVFSTFGLGYTATKFIAEMRRRAEEQVGQIARISINITLCTSMLFAVVLLIFAPAVAGYLDAEYLAPSLRIFAVNIVFNALTTVQIGILAGFNEFRAIAINKTIVGVTTFLLSVIMTWFWGIEGALTALLLATVLNCVLNNIVVRRRLKQLRRRGQRERGITRRLLLFSLPITLQEAVFSVTGWVMIAMLVKLCDYGQVGLYSAAGQWAGVILFIPGVLVNVTLSHLAGSNDDAAHHRRIFRRMIAVNIVSTLVPSVVVFLLAGVIASFYGASFAALPIVLSVAVGTTILNAVSNVYTQEFMARSRYWIMFAILSAKSILVLGMAYRLITGLPDGNNGAYYLSLSNLVVMALTVAVTHIVYVCYERKMRRI